MRRVDFVCSLVGASVVQKQNFPYLKDVVIDISYLRGLRRSAFVWVDFRFETDARMVPQFNEHDPEIRRT